MNKFITFEGIDGCGKTTQIELISKHLNNNNVNNKIVREPGSNNISEKIREILLDKNNVITFETETLLFLSARSHLVDSIIKKELENNVFILCDRFIDSTMAYQGYGRKLNRNLIQDMNLFATQNLFPYLTIIFDIDPEIAHHRINSNNFDRMENCGIDFQKKVRDGYLDN